jgi:hypothetical protein
MDEMVYRLSKVPDMTSEQHWFKRGAGFAKTYFSWLLRDNKQTRQKLKTCFPGEYQEILTFTGLNVDRYEVLLFAYTGAFLSFLILCGLMFVITISYYDGFWEGDAMTMMLLGISLIVVPLVLVNALKNYPKTYAKYLQIRSLGDVPEVLSYLVMYLKLIPNLENSVKFTASESTTILATDLRKLVWDLEIRVYHGIDDAMSDFATRWGRWSEFFKRSLHLLCSSIQEREEASRIITLDRSLDVSLEGTKETMNQFVNRLHQPTVMLYSLGIMIPLSLVAMLPAAGLVGVKITIVQVFLLYDVLLPLFVFLYSRHILLSRPATFNPPSIPVNHPDLVDINKKRCLYRAVLIGIGVGLPGVFFLSIPLLFPHGSSNPYLQMFITHQGSTAFLPVTLFFIWGVGATISFYCLSVYGPHKKVRDTIKQMEKEFSDALYILGKRLSEEKSPEEGFLYTARTMQGAQIAEVFRQTSYNLTAMHVNFHDAMFNDEFGALRYVYSDRIKAILRLFVEGTQKSQQAVSASLIRIADHLKQLQEVEQKIKDMLYELTSTIQTTISVFAPLIAGVTLSITTLISKVLTSLHSTISLDTMTDLSPTFSGMTDAFTLENVRPEYFVLVIGIYLIQLVVLLTRLINGINEGDDKATYMYRLGKTLPLALLVFSLTILIGQWFFSEILQSM